MPYIARQRWCADAQGRAVDPDDPSAVTVLVGAGGTLSDEEAQRSGVLDLELALATKGKKKADAEAKKKAAEEEALLKAEEEAKKAAEEEAKKAAAV